MRRYFSNEAAAGGPAASPLTVLVIHYRLVLDGCPLSSQDAIGVHLGSLGFTWDVRVCVTQQGAGFDNKHISRAQTLGCVRSA